MSDSPAGTRRSAEAKLNPPVERSTTLLGPVVFAGCGLRRLAISATLVLLLCLATTEGQASQFTKRPPHVVSSGCC